MQWTGQDFEDRCSLIPKMDCFIQIISFEEKFHGNCIFLAIGCVLEQNLRKEIPLRIQFYCQNIMTLPIETISKAWQWYSFDFGINFTHFYIVTSNLLPNFLMAVSHSFFNIMVSELFSSPWYIAINTRQIGNFINFWAKNLFSKLHLSFLIHVYSGQPSAFL